MQRKRIVKYFIINMKTIKSLKEITTLEVGDAVVFGDLEYIVDKNFKHNSTQYYLHCPTKYNGTIFEILNFRKKDFTEKLGIDANCNCDFPETKSLEALTAIVSALFKEYEKQNELPKTWEEFCERYPFKAQEAFINSASKPIPIGDYIDRKYRIPDSDRNFCTSRQEAEAFLALMQLRQLRKVYVKDWEPDWTRKTFFNWCINFENNKLRVYPWSEISHPLSFPTAKIAEQFLNNFKDLLEIAKPLL
jgi:hypothetical protein